MMKRSLAESSAQRWGSRVSSSGQWHNRKKSKVELSFPILGFSNQPPMTTQSKHNMMLCIMQGGP